MIPVVSTSPRFADTFASGWCFVRSDAALPPRCSKGFLFAGECSHAASWWEGFGDFVRHVRFVSGVLQSMDIFVTSREEISRSR